MLDEDAKRMKIVERYSYMYHSHYKLCRWNNNYSNFAHVAVAFVRYLPNWATTDVQELNLEKVSVLDMYTESSGIGDLDAIAYLLTDRGIPKWIKADIARIYLIPMGYGVALNAYNNVHMRRRKKWGLFV